MKSIAQYQIPLSYRQEKLKKLCEVLRRRHGEERERAKNFDFLANA